MDASSSARWGALRLSLAGLIGVSGLLLWCWRKLGFCMCAEWHLRRLILHMEPLISYLVLAFREQVRGHGISDRASGCDLRRPYITVPVYSFVVFLSLVGFRFVGGSAPSSCFFPRLMPGLSREFCGIIILSRQYLGGACCTRTLWSIGKFSVNVCIPASRRFIRHASPRFLRVEGKREGSRFYRGGASVCNQGNRW